MVRYITIFRLLFIWVWYIKSNRESGNGYSDIFIKIEKEDIGIIIEVKYAEKAQYDLVCEDAFQQIEQTGYTEELIEEGCHTILQYCIACCKKECRVRCHQEEKTAPCLPKNGGNA